jgi:hypothetical protein
MKFYGDDSFGRNGPGADGCCTVAGYETDCEIWKELTKDWRAVLDTPPKINYFRMREYESRLADKDEDSGQFLGLSKTDATAKFNALVSVLENFGSQIAWVDSIITWDTFNYGLSSELRDFYKSPHYLCIFGIIEGCREICRRLDIGEDVPVDFIFDQQPGIDILIHQAWSFAKQYLPEEDTHIMKKIGFEDDKVTAPLQCSDLLAWHVRRNYIRPPEDHRRPRPAYKLLRRSVRVKMSSVWREEGLKQMAKEASDRLMELPDHKIWMAYLLRQILMCQRPTKGKTSR